MGLDNGIVVKDRLNPENEICYWRKCWNIRSAIFDIIGRPSLEDETYEYSLSLENVVDIYYMLKNLKKDNWYENGSSIWEWDEIKKGIKRDIKELNRLIKAMKKNENLEVFFYDSY